MSYIKPFNSSFAVSTWSFITIKIAGATHGRDKELNIPGI
jgi:hypothetical protein